MPQLVKGGKHTYGWTIVGPNGEIAVPPDALKEYGISESAQLLVVPGSRTSGGFGLGLIDVLASSPLGGNTYARVTLRNGHLVMAPAMRHRFGVPVGSRLLVIRGSGRAIGFAVRGPIVEEATKHDELSVYDASGQR